VRLAYHLTVTAHVLAAVVWLGGMIAFALLAPVLRRVGDDADRQRLFHDLGGRFRTVGWICIAVLVGTGVGQLHVRGWWGTAFWTAPGLWSSPLGHALTGKLVTVVAMLAVQAVHDFHLGPAAGRVEPGTAEARALRRKAALLARINAFAAVLLVWFAVRLPRGG
jgi:putative copper resistance protein D